MWTPPERNMDRIQFAELRKLIDRKFNKVHDELSDCYYNGKPFRNYGILTKEDFDKLHGLIFLKRDIEFHAENLKQSLSAKIAEEKYNWLDDAGNLKKSDFAASKISAMKSKGFDLII